MRPDWTRGGEGKARHLNLAGLIGFLLLILVLLIHHREGMLHESGPTSGGQPGYKSLLESPVAAANHLQVPSLPSTR